MNKAETKTGFEKLQKPSRMRTVLEVEKPKESKQTFKRLLQYFVDERKLLIGLLLAVTMGVLCNVYAPKLQSQAIDSITSGAFGVLTQRLGLMLAIYLIYGLTSLFQSRLSAHLSQRVVKTMRKDLFDKIIDLPIKYVDQHAHGDLMSRMTNDVENISDTISQSLSSLVAGILTIIGTVVMMFSLSWQLTLLSCTTVLLTILVTKKLAGWMRRFYRQKQILLGRLNAQIEEHVIGYQTVVAYNRQPQIVEDFSLTADALTKTSIRSDILSGLMGPAMNVINNIGFVIIAVCGGYFAIHGMISIGVISAFIVYARQFGRPINELAQIYGQIETALAGAERVFAILDETSESSEGSCQVPLSKGRIQFENVDFSYIPEKQVLYDFSLEIRSGHKVALVGATGSAKTTVVNLLMRFYDIDSGRILIDGTDIRDIERDTLRKDIAIVLQDTVLFTDTIRNNLKYSNPSADDEQMRKAARLSYCDKLISQLPRGYDTLLSGSGNNLSQGQRQLLAIGRAFLADPKILILDEATSSVDTRTEKHIQDAMINLMKDRTSLIIAHRLSTIQDADCIVVMDQGRIAEQGSHDELLAKKGKYYELYNTQFEGKAI